MKSQPTEKVLDRAGGNLRKEKNYSRYPTSKYGFTTAATGVPFPLEENTAMHHMKFISRLCLGWTFAAMFVLGLFFIGAGVWGWRWFVLALPQSYFQGGDVSPEALKACLDRLMPMMAMIKTYAIPLVCALLCVVWLLLWLVLRMGIARRLRRAVTPDVAVIPAPKPAGQPAPSASTAQEKKEALDANRRFYLHLLTVLQREGRLMDFFAEDLAPYEDAQIGAAVRSIQENCKQSLFKYLNPKAIVDRGEGEELSVPADFDPNAIKLTGNVSGQPPFRGIVRHRGWRAAKLELPTLSTARDALVIAPAEIEIP